MKRIVLLALLASLLMPNSAQAAETKFVGGPLENLAATGATINISLSGVPSKAGLYMQQVVQPAPGARPTLSNSSAELWISTSPGASFLPTAAIVFKPTATFTSGMTFVDCAISKCGIFIRFDRTLTADTSEDQFIPLTFKSATTTTTLLPNDEISATIDGVVVSTRVPATLGYRQVATLMATSKAGAPLTYASLTPACALSGVSITPLSGTGQCAISVTSASTATSTGVRVILPIQLALGSQTLSGKSLPKSLKVGQKINLPKLSNFGEKLTYQVKGGCSLTATRLSVKKGSCVLTISAPGMSENYAELALKHTILIK
jgi:hypothetical protein